jgi:hypothetical protein
MSQDSPQQTPELITLKTFIDEYQKTISVIGVFVALGLLWKNISPEKSVPYLSYLCFLITIPLFIEVRRAYDYNKSTWGLVIFQDIFTGILLFSVYHLLVDYPEHLERIIPGLVWAVTFLGLGALADKIFTNIRTNNYNRVVQRVEAMDKQGLPMQERNKIVTEWNAQLSKLNSKVTIVEVLSIIAIFILAFSAAALVSEYSHAFIDVVFDRNDEVVEPPQMDK